MEKEINKEIDEIEDDEIEEEVEVLEFALADEEIDDLIQKLQKLKETKSSVNFEIDEDNELLIHHADDVGEDDE